jgi:hypothetical protein
MELDTIQRIYSRYEERAESLFANKGAAGLLNKHDNLVQAICICKIKKQAYLNTLRRRSGQVDDIAAAIRRENDYVTAFCTNLVQVVVPEKND